MDYETKGKTGTKALLPLLIAFALIPLAFLVPGLDSTRQPYADLDPGNSAVALALSDSAHVIGVTLLGFVLIGFLITRPLLPSGNRLRESLVIAAVALVFAGAGSWLNEHEVKEWFKQPRPNIEWLASEQGATRLGMSPVEFYELGDKEQRAVHLDAVLSDDSIPVTDAVKAHWLEETGYSFPSGHSFSAFFFATLFLCLASTLVVSKRRWLFYLLLPWAVLSCYARLILRVHTPLDITAGAAAGLVLGLLAWLIAAALLRRLAST